MHERPNGWSTTRRHLQTQGSNEQSHTGGGDSREGYERLDSNDISEVAGCCQDAAAADQQRDADPGREAESCPDIFGLFDSHAWPMHDLCMATKTISIEIDAYELLVREKRDPKESFSRVIRRVLSERPALTAGDLLEAMKAFEGRGAGPRRRRDRNAAA